MALIKCKQCGNENAKDAKTCPKCGTKLARRFGCGSVIVGVLVLFGLTGALAEHNERAEKAAVAAASSSASAPVATSAPADPKPAPSRVDVEMAAWQKKTDEMVAGFKSEPAKVTKAREAFIRRLQANDLLVKIEKPAAHPHVFVGPAFYGLTVDEKANMLGVIMTKYMRESTGEDAYTLVLYDGLDGKKIGRFDLKGGLDLD